MIVQQVSVYVSFERWFSMKAGAWSSCVLVGGFSGLGIFGVALVGVGLVMKVLLRASSRSACDGELCGLGVVDRV